jgi:biopolymer transport protein ExbB/TolQ
VWELQVAQAALLGEGEVRRGLPFLALTAKLVLLVGTLGVANGVTEMLRSLAPTAGRDLAAWAPGAAAALATATATVVVAAPTVIALHFLRGQAAAFLDDIRRSARRLAGAHAGPAPEARP